MTRKYVALLVVVLVAGCANEAAAPISPENNQEDFLALKPADGESSVRLDAPVILTFAKPVDRAAVERGLLLISERAMADSLCPVSQTMDHGNMMGSMVDSSKMHHLDQYHASKGSFTWNTNSTQCMFQPDSLMTPKTSYMLRMNREMTQMIEQRLGSMGMMGGHGTGMMSSEMMFHFFTMDTTGLGNGHNGHH